MGGDCSVSNLAGALGYLAFALQPENDSDYLPKLAGSKLPP